MDTVAICAFWIAFATLFHVYLGYEKLLRVLVTLLRRPSPLYADPADTTVTVLLTVHNEADDIIARLDNLLEQDFPANRLDIFVVSDGSTDETVTLTDAYIRQHASRRITLLPLAAQNGKSMAQNQALSHLQGEIVVLTDAATRFAPDFISRISSPFTDPKVGCVTGTVAFGKDQSAVAHGQSRYWQSEMTMRDCESRLNILAVASGQAMAVRRNLLRPLPAHVGDDCIIPLDVVAAGSLVRHAAAAIAHDVNETRIHRELRARARMTARNWTGTWIHPRLLSPLHHPGFAFALWSHKLLRWLSPLLLAMMGISALLLSHMSFYAAICGLGGLFIVCAGIGLVAPQPTESSHPAGFRLLLRLSRLCFAFTLAQFGFLKGLWIAMTGKRIHAYSNRR